MLQPSIDNAMNHLQKALIWIHDPSMYSAFLLGARIIKPRRIVYFNPELLAVFKEMELIREIEAKRKEEIESKRRVKKHRRSSSSKPK